MRYQFYHTSILNQHHVSWAFIPAEHQKKSDTYRVYSNKRPGRLFNFGTLVVIQNAHHNQEPQTSSNVIYGHA